MNARCWLLFLGSLVLLGCGGGTKQPATPEQLKGRLDAASAMSDIGKRNEALATLAQEAADAGETEVTNRALDQILDLGQKNSAAYSCALKLAEGGKTQVAVEVAKKITDLGKRNDALGRIARGR